MWLRPSDGVAPSSQGFGDFGEEGRREGNADEDQRLVDGICESELGPDGCREYQQWSRDFIKHGSHTCFSPAARCPGLLALATRPQSAFPRGCFRDVVGGGSFD